MFFNPKYQYGYKKELKLDDVLLDEFVELLEVIYPSHKPVNGQYCFSFNFRSVLLRVFIIWNIIVIVLTF
ncbi:unnamed protein product [Anisakis simplex]|uniref:Uncharacterized protein n=1 Tax=Anisakis simplex TaxID=6269 RepID=A0A0M3JQM2_ANISI|nr:unnamed protein product [Anisakis simplex]